MTDDPKRPYRQVRSRDFALGLVTGMSVMLVVAIFVAAAYAAACR